MNSSLFIRELDASQGHLTLYPLLHSGLLLCLSLEFKLLFLLYFCDYRHLFPFEALLIST